MKNWIVYVRGDVASLARDAGYKSSYRNGKTSIYVQATHAAAAVDLVSGFGDVLDWKPKQEEA